jgi:GT2 family glycosyltransferase
MGNNLAATYALGEKLLLLNPDTVILNGAIQKILEFSRIHSDAGIFGGRTFFGDGTLNYNSCHGGPTPWSMLSKGLGLSSIFRQSRWFDSESLGPWRRDSARTVDAVTGCFLLIRKSLWTELGGFDETFFMYGEDTDLCLRAWKAGYICMICPDAQLIHYGGQSESVRADKMVKLFTAKARLFEKHWRAGDVWFGLCMLDLWAWSRMVALGLLRHFRPGANAGYEAWREIWRRRREWHGVHGPVQPVAGLTKQSAAAIHE